MMRRMFGVGVCAMLGLAAVACSGGDDDDDAEGSLADPGDCVPIDVAISPEKAELLGDLAESFNRSDDAEVDGDCLFVRVQTKSSGRAEQLLATDWDEAVEGPRPVIWSPAASTWGNVLNQHLSEANRPALVSDDFEEFMLTPLVIAMPQPMAEALGWPDTPIGFADILALARDGQGWASKGHPEWGPFRLGKTNPNFSTSGLSALVAQTYAATGKTSGLSAEDLDRPDVDEFAKGVESAVVHYGDTTLTFLNNWYRADQRGNPFQYVSAVAVEEKSVIDYNRGNPDGVLDTGEEARPPRVPLVAIYPKEGTLYSNNPLFTLDAEWVDQTQKDGAARFVDYVMTTANQEKVLEYGFRPSSPDVQVGDPIAPANGVNPAPPQTLLEVPQPAVLAGLLDHWTNQRKGARVLLVIDVSGSMGDPATDSGATPTKLDLAKQAAADALDQFNDDDEVGLWTFSTDLGPNADQTVLELVPTARVGDVREQLQRQIAALVPMNNTPLYEVTAEAYQRVVDEYDPARINAVVVLSDGENSDGDDSDDGDQLNDLISQLDNGAESSPVRIFPVGYGLEADMPTLRQIAEASNGAAYDASDPASITRVLNAVISNF